ncbi:unnamed protein product [Oikopleura dioica]|uniref:BTB domain-containing protein n=1 Tax=Oikopleura dioica TaxID=34765 RepID=E4XXC4_OIKDI|nr:unnamed protein product [Oikopleura dioica]
MARSKILQQQRQKNVNCDILIVASNGAGYPAHSALVTAQSHVFRVMLESGFKEGTEKRVTTNIKETTLRNLLDAAYCQDVSTLTFTQACDLLQATLFYEFDHICKIVVKFLVQCCRHRCPESCCMFEDPSSVTTALARFQEREYYARNIANIQHICDVLFLFIHRQDENPRVAKMIAAIKQTLESYKPPLVNALKYGEIKTIITALLNEESWKSQDLRPELPVTTCLLFDIFDVVSNCDDEVTRDTLVQNEILVRILNVTEFIQDVNVEKIQTLQPYCCKSYGECKHQQEMLESRHKSQIREQLVSDQHEFKLRTSLSALEHSYRDSDDEEILVDMDDEMSPAENVLDLLNRDGEEPSPIPESD